MMGTVEEEGNTAVCTGGRINGVGIKPVSNQLITGQSDPFALVFKAVIANPLHLPITLDRMFRAANRRQGRLGDGRHILDWIVPQIKPRGSDRRPPPRDAPRQSPTRRAIVRGACHPTSWYNSYTECDFTSAGQRARPCGGTREEESGSKRLARFSSILTIKTNVRTIPSSTVRLVGLAAHCSH